MGTPELGACPGDVVGPAVFLVVVDGELGFGHDACHRGVTVVEGEHEVGAILGGRQLGEVGLDDTHLAIRRQLDLEPLEEVGNQLGAIAEQGERQLVGEGRHGRRVCRTGAFSSGKGSVGVRGAVGTLRSLRMRGGFLISAGKGA